MLNVVIRDWLERLSSERGLDAPLMALLAAKGFKDIHLTHGRNEIGKDIIAKDSSSGEVVQFAFQSKLGDLDTRRWDNEIRNQMEKAVTLGLQHPQWDSSLPREGVLVITGRVGDGVQGQIDLFNEELERRGYCPINVWAMEMLVSEFAAVDPTAVYRSDAGGIAAYGEFFRTYGEALSGTLTERGIEQHSRHWVGVANTRKRLLLAIIEAYSIADACRSIGDLYLALQALLAGWRAIMYASVASQSNDRYIDELMVAAREAVVAAAYEYVTRVKDLRERAGGRLINIVGGSPPATYPVHCLRVMEAAALTYFLATAEEQRSGAIELLRKIVVTEQGAQHPISDRYAVSIVASVRALRAAGEEDVARRYLCQVATWVLAQYVAREGLGSVEDSEEAAVRRLFSHELKEIKPPRRDDSFIATALLDLAALLGDAALYRDIENDVRANRVIPRYYQPQNTVGQLLIDGEDVVAFANVRFARGLDGDSFSYGPHLDGEPRTFTLSDRFGPAPLLAVSLLLRDRYFPTTWVLDS